MESTELKNTRTEVKKTLEGINSSLDEPEERISDLEDSSGTHQNRATKRKK